MINSMERRTIEFYPNGTLERLKKAVLLIFVITETLYKTIFGLHLAVAIERTQCVAGVLLVILIAIEFLRLCVESKKKWIKKHLPVFVYFFIRMITFIYIGCPYTMLRSLLFEVVYLLALTELVVDGEFCKKVVFKFFIIVNFVLNFISVVIYACYEIIININNSLGETIVSFIGDNTYFGDLAGCYYSSMYSNPNQMGIMTGIAIILSLHYFCSKKSTLSKIFFILYYVFSLYCLWISNCASANLALVCVLVILLGKKCIKGINGKSAVLICLCGVMVITSGIYLFVSSHSDLESFTYMEQTINNMGNSRYKIWKDSYYSHKDEFLLGCGNMTLEKRDRYQYNLDKGIDYGFDINGSLIDFVGPHNGYVGMISCAGILGFIAFIALLIKKVKDSNTLNQGYWYLAIIFILIINIFECMMPISKNFCTLYMFLLLGMDDREEVK